MNLALWLHRAARLWPDRPALLHGADVVADYAAFADRAARLAARLCDEFHFVSGDRAALFLKNSPDYLTILYAVWYAGGAVVPINAKLHPREAGWIVANAQAKLLFADPGVAEEIADHCRDEGHETLPADAQAGDALPQPAPAARAGSDLAWLFYTSGTTGRPKGVMMSHAMLTDMALTYFADVDEVRGEDAALYAAPMSHGAGIYNFMHVLRGARHVVPRSGGFDADEIIALAPQLGSVHMFAAPTMVSRLLAAAKDAGWHGEGLRTVVYGGGPMYLADIEAALDWFGDRFVQIYGQGECPMAITALSRELLADRAHPRWAERAASVGLAQSCVEVAVVGEDAMPLAAGETGEIIVRGVPVMQGYWRNKQASAAAVRDGWLWTGDMGALDEDGFLTLKDRSKDVIISGGTNIYPREVEEALLVHPDVAEVSVIGQPDPDWGENVAAFVVARSGCSPTPETLDAHCRDHIARFKRPKLYRFVTALPKNAYGKVLKTELRGMLAGGREGT
ncbi:MAG: AMP-binding protein [Novosphingobium sp.]|nr:AMP-binding protein [Novosphingobium sp.]MCP5400908.1 AMP-binding protein [Novosphingobium sp.]